MKKSILVIAILVGILNAIPSKAQMGIAYYPFQSIVSLNSDSEKLAWADLRMETNTFISNLNFEINAMWNFIRKDRLNYYLGLGININPFYALEELEATNGYLIHFGTRIKPFKKAENLQIAFEISPYLNTSFNAGQIRSLIGIAYNF
mgnify:CR=1 FL=1|tara:strand:- start:26567 stop:27010 length:444 start_codon:yes stop_codon:yes gene_type:complete